MMEKWQREGTQILRRAGHPGCDEEGRERVRYSGAAL